MPSSVKPEDLGSLGDAETSDDEEEEESEAEDAEDPVVDAIWLRLITTYDLSCSNLWCSQLQELRFPRLPAQTVPQPLVMQHLRVSPLEILGQKRMPASRMQICKISVLLTDLHMHACMVRYFPKAIVIAQEPPMEKPHR